MIRLCAGDPQDWLQRHRGKRPVFTCILSFTDTALIPGISAAGASPAARLNTALADAALLKTQQQEPPKADRQPAGTQQAAPYTATSAALLSRTKPGDRTQHALPALAAGISPVLISRAVLAAQKIPVLLLSTGLPQALTVPHVALPQAIAQPVNTGQALPLKIVKSLLAAGCHWGLKLARQHPNSYLIVSECVVGGTTTAQALLTALGYTATGLTSSSHPHGNHQQKQALVNAGISQWKRAGIGSPLGAVAAIGDPMQVAAAGMALAASTRCGVMLAGGSQMLAVYALIKAIAPQLSGQFSCQLHQIVVGTTRWVIEDRSAHTIAIAQQIQVPYLASELSFQQSPYMQLRAYEQGHIKEGVGAGGCAIAANLYQNWTQSQLRHAVEAQLRYWL